MLENSVQQHMFQNVLENSIFLTYNLKNIKLERRKFPLVQNFKGIEKGEKRILMIS